MLSSPFPNHGYFMTVHDFINTLNNIIRNISLISVLRNRTSRTYQQFLLTGGTGFIGRAFQTLQHEFTEQYLILWVQKCDLAKKGIALEKQKNASLMLLAI